MITISYQYITAFDTLELPPRLSKHFYKYCKNYNNIMSIGYIVGVRTSVLFPYGTRRENAFYLSHIFLESDRFLETRRCALADIATTTPLQLLSACTYTQTFVCVCIHSLYARTHTHTQSYLCFTHHHGAEAINMAWKIYILT